MEALAVIKWNQNEHGEHTTLFAKLSPLQCAEIAASKYGFFDLDVDSDDRGVKITAMAHNRTVVAKGKSLTLAVERLMEIFTE